MKRGIVVVAVAALAFAACVQDRGPESADPFLEDDPVQSLGPTARPPGGPVLALGDSLMRGADEHGHLGGILALDGWELEAIAENGRSVRWAIDEIDTRIGRLPRHVVVVLGSNPGFSSEGFEEDVRELLALLVRRGARRILWLPPHHLEDPERYAEKVEILRAADREDGRLVVPDWGGVLDAHPEWVRSEGLHLTEDGYAAMAVFIRDWLNRLG